MVVAEPALQLIVAVAALEQIVVITALQHIPAGHALQRVGTAVTEQVVVASLSVVLITDQPIAAEPAPQGVVVGTALQPVVAGAS